MAACPVCICIKDATTKPAGLLHPLPIPKKRFASYSIDFMFMPLTPEGYNAIMTVVERLSKKTTCIPCTMGDSQLSAEEAATLIFHHIVHHYRVPAEIISNRDAQFASDFWHTLWKRLGTKCIHLTAFHL